MPNRKILVADDIEDRTEADRERSQAIGRAASFLAQRLGTGIDLLYVEDAGRYPTGRRDPARFAAWHASLEHRLEEAARRIGGAAGCCLASGSPVEEILKAIHSRPSPELVVVGTRGLKGVKRLFMGSVAEEVVRHSRRPVLVIGPKARRRVRELSGRTQPRLLVPTDLGRSSRSAERYALSLARRIKGKVTLYHCLWDIINAIIVNTAYGEMAVCDLQGVIEQCRQEAAEVLERKAAFFQKHGVACSFTVEEQSLLSRAAVPRESSGYTFVVMGTHGRNTLLTAFLGSTARETIMNAPVPVVIVHS